MSDYIRMGKEDVRDLKLIVKLIPESLSDRFDHENVTLFGILELLFDEKIGEKEYPFAVNNNITLRSMFF